MLSSTKPLPEPMLTKFYNVIWHQWATVSYIFQFHQYLWPFWMMTADQNQYLMQKSFFYVTATLYLHNLTPEFLQTQVSMNHQLYISGISTTRGQLPWPCLDPGHGVVWKWPRVTCTWLRHKTGLYISLILSLEIIDFSMAKLQRLITFFMFFIRYRNI